VRLFFRIDFWTLFFQICNGFWLSFTINFWWFFIFLATPYSSMILYWFSSIWAWILVSFLMLFWYLYLSRAQPSKPSKALVFTMNFNDFTIQRNIIFDDVPDLSVTSFGIDF
jgi:hypothetical protein